ncbi:hypothetical protein SDC9_173525 [bioreactor metagenome]|uniref:Uncharacterized protein n=1 Tax=bioreactor metagenome TaxID=1076179 RepID=A0A645GGM1_9ZZZZ
MILSVRTKIEITAQLIKRILSNTYSDKAAKVPFWIKTIDDYVISVTEQLVN